MLEMGVKHLLRYQPQNFLEIGSRDGHDTHTISNNLSIEPSNCYIFEAHSDCFVNIQEQYPQYNSFNCAVSNKTELITFNAGIVGIEDNIGCSSILDDATGTFRSKKVTVDGWRFDDISKHIGLSTVDLVKIDVEGHTHEVLEGFGESLRRTKAIQLELEHKEGWKGQKLYQDISNFLISNSFEQVFYVKHSHDQSDSFWANKHFFNI
jgi:FkbM family methyltransferase